MAVVYLARHGQASFGAADYDVLSERGAEQSRALGVELARRGVRPERVVSGRLKRQQDTLRIALEAAGLERESEVDPRLDEYDHQALLSHHLAENRTSLFVGAMTSGRARTAQRALDGALGRWLAAGDCPECERSWTRFDEETTAAVGEVLETLGSGGTGLLVTSGGVIGAVVARLLGLSTGGFVTISRVIANASLTKVVHGRGGTTLISFNEHSHFEGDASSLLTYR